MSISEKPKRTLEQRLAALAASESQLRVRRQRLAARNRVAQRRIELRVKILLGENLITSLASAAAADPTKADGMKIRISNMLKNAVPNEKEMAIAMFASAIRNGATEKVDHPTS
jgi:hypothetical protein